MPSRARLMDRIDQAITRSRRHPQAGFALLVLDIDHFRRVNARFGDEGGDGVLREVAGRLQRVARPGDLVARIGSDRFGILVEDTTDATTGARVAERVLCALDTPVRIGGEDVVLSTSIGIATSGDGYCRAGAVLHDGDAALHRAKRSARGSYAMFDPAMHDRASRRLQLEQDLRRALNREEFELHYQPIVALDSDETVGYEALLRWRHPVEGILTPDRFLAVLCESGLIVPVGRWVRREACLQTATWRALGHPPVRVSVNVTQLELSQPDFIPQLADAVASAGLTGEALTVEVTEEALVDDSARASETFAELRRLGVRVVIDDFGRGYSSLAYLRELPVDGLKLDRSFIAGIETPGSPREILRAIVTLGHVLGLRITGEGVETRDHRAALRELGCDDFQGYFASRPVRGEVAPDARPRCAAV